MRKLFPIIAFILFTIDGFAQQNNTAKIKELEIQKKEAAAKGDYATASKLKKQIAELKDPNSTTNRNASKIAGLEIQKKAAADKGDYATASKLKKQIAALKDPSSSTNRNASKIATLEKQKKAAADKGDYATASKLKKQIAALNNPSSPANKNATKITALEKRKQDAAAKGDYATASKLKKQIAILENPALAPKPIAKKGSNLRETQRLNMTKQDFATTNTYLVASAQSSSQKVKLKHSAENDLAKDLKYRRNSVYTLMVNDMGRKHATVIKDAFGNAEIPQKFNDHNIGPYLINTRAVKDPKPQIDAYLLRENVAKKIVAKWFNRSTDGAFNMDLVAARGEYDATAVDKAVAGSLQRGDAILADAGEELIGKTFVIVHNFRYTNKENIAKGAKAGMMAGRFIGGALGMSGTINTALKVGETAVTAAGKGYIVRTSSYLYRLVWNEETEAIFYNNHWTDDASFDQTKANAFNSATNYKLQYIGMQSAGADVQSSVFSNKNESDLIRMATVKATNRAVAKLEKKFEAFRTKTPLYTASPITARIGTKDGLEGGDKFEVLEQVYDAETGKMSYNRVGVISVDGGNIWENSMSPEEEAELKKQGKLTKRPYTYFKGSGNYYPGQLIKQIN